MRKISLLLLLSFTIIVLPQFKTTSNFNEETPVSNVLMALGETSPKHYPKVQSKELIKMGEDLVLLGRTKKSNGLKSKYISKHYVCTSCHNINQEDPDLRYSNPETRLSYVVEKKIPFLQGTTFFGMVNRETWYNDDYIKKYGDLAVKAHDDLIESIQLCAEVCSQGRRLEDWELNAVVNYVWTLGYKLKDLGLTSADYRKLNEGVQNSTQHGETVSWLKSFYALKSPATFSNSPADKSAGYADIKENAINGKMIYEWSCGNCHHANGESNLLLDNTKMTFRKFQRNLAKEGNFSIYNIIRYGTHPMEGHRPYMPHYTLERMSHQQVEDLRAYIEQEAI